MVTPLSCGELGTGAGERVRLKSRSFQGQGHLWGKEKQNSSKWSLLFWSQCCFKCWTRSQWGLALEMVR